MAAKKITETPDFVKGLLKSADEISKSLDSGKMHPRVLLEKLRGGEKKLACLSREERRELGKYQARVVLVVLAAELALKLLWEQDKDKPADQNHKIDQLFNCLCPSLKCQIRNEYCKLAEPAPCGWDTPDEIFKRCKDASVQWRYLVEECNFPEYVMQRNT